MVAQGVRTDRRSRRLGSPLGGGGSLHPKPAVLGENGHDAGDSAHRIGEERTRARVDGRRVGRTTLALLLLAHLVAGTVDLSREAHGESVAAPDGLLEQQGAQDACTCADEVERESDEAEPVRHFAQGVRVGVRDGDQLRLDTCNERADRDESVNSIEKCLVAIRLFLQMLDWSFRFELVKEMGNGGKQMQSARNRWPRAYVNVYLVCTH